MSKIFLSVVIPSYNEEANLKRGVLKEVYDYLKTKNFSWEVIVSDDGSTDDSKKIVDAQIKDFKNFRLLSNIHGGKPSALLYGIKSARGRYILIADMDQSTPINQLDKLLPFIKKGYDVVIGSRGVVRKNFPLYRKLGAMIFMSVRRLLILPEISDTQCGFKLFEARALKNAFPKLEFFKREKVASGWKVTSFDVELLHLLKKGSSRIKEVKVLWDDKDVSKGKGGGLVRYIRESQEMFSQILRIKLNELRGLY
jgi:dolichyl-phosphate beta-glucosyltransferase